MTGGTSTHDLPTHTLSEARSKELLASFGVPFAAEREVIDLAGAQAAAEALGYPVVAKLCGDQIAHKTERGLVRLHLGDAEAVASATAELLAAATPEDGDVSILIAPMLSGSREFIAGLTHDPQFGMTVMVGVGGVLAEAVADVTIRLVPIDAITAGEMIDDLRTQSLIGPFRGEPPVEVDAIVQVLMALSAAAASHPEIRSVDLNPLIIVDGRPIAVDALVEVISR